MEEAAKLATKASGQKPSSVEVGGGSKPGSFKGKVTGAGVEDNVYHAVVTIAGLKELPDIVNLVGFSRGAVTTLMIANALYDYKTQNGLFRSIQVNICAVDPVAGGSRGTDANSATRSLIPPTVKNYLAFLAKGENRAAFSPQDLSRVVIMDPKESNVMFLPFPGKHGTVAESSDPKGRFVSQICFSLAHRFFAAFDSHQTRTAPMQLTNTGMLDAYSGDPRGWQLRQAQAFLHGRDEVCPGNLCDA